jgi:hypothetical protein
MAIAKRRDPKDDGRRGGVVIGIWTTGTAHEQSKKLDDIANHWTFFGNPA